MISSTLGKLLALDTNTVHSTSLCTPSAENLTWRDDALERIIRTGAGIRQLFAVRLRRMVTRVVLR
jgi:hypothetical protein